jgi:hypothetical protein
VSLRSGFSLDASSQAAWKKIVDENKERTFIRLSEPFELTCRSGDERHSQVIPQGTEVSLFCNMSGSYRRPSAGSAFRTVGTFFLQDGLQISVLIDWRIRVNAAAQEIRPQTQRRRVSTSASVTLANRH